MDDKELIESTWNVIQEETERRVKAEPVLASFFHTTILEHKSVRKNDYTCVRNKSSD